MTHSQSKIQRFKELYGLIKPDAQATERIALTARMAALGESSVRVYLMDEPPHPPSERTLLILEKEMRRRKMI